jgi:5S rRNA maturation endonuclease (ribonuclease M5)
MDIEKSLVTIQETVTQLQEENTVIPIIVEGEKDIEALKKMKINGTIIPVNHGISIIEFCDQIARKYKEIILLTDWDKKGGYLCHTINKNLQGRVKCNLKYREIFAKNSMVKTVEGLPSWIEKMKNKMDYAT